MNFVFSSLFCLLACFNFFLIFRICLQDADVQRVMLRLSTEYPGDLGILMPLMLNLLQLKTGQSFFMTVDEPHAYLRGDILEVLLYCCDRAKRRMVPFPGVSGKNLSF